MSKKNNSKLNKTILALFFAFLVMMYLNTLIGLFILTFIVIWNIYTSRYAFHTIKGNKAYTRKDFNSALYYYGKAIECKSVPASIIRGYVIIELKYGDPSVALNTLTDILSHRKFNDDDITSLRVSKALILWKCGKTLDSFELLNELLENVEDLYVYETLSSLLLIQNKPQEALELLEKALKFDSNSDVLKSNFAEANFKIGKSNFSEDIFLELTEKNISFVEPYYFYAKILISKSENVQAIEILNRALNTNDSLLTTVTKEDVNKLLKSINN